MPEGYLLTTHEFDVPAGTRWTEHQHDEHELLWSDGGLVRLEADGRVWAIPPSLGVWLPAGVPHRAGTESAAQVRSTYFVPTAGTLAAMPDRVTGVAMTDPVRVLLGHNLQGNLDDDARLRLQRVVLDLLAPAPEASFDLVMPQSTHLRMVGDAVLADPADGRSTGDWAYECGMHPRTLSRQFEAETGMTLTRWRILARMQLAVRELHEGRSIVSISRMTGYRSPSTFIDHFRALTGQTPAEYVRRPR